MQKGDVIPPEERVARAVIYPTHLPAQQLADESLLNFQADSDPASVGPWGHAYALSVTYLALCEPNEVHRSGMSLASAQNEARPLSATDESEVYGHRRHYLGYYAFETRAAPPSVDGKDELVTVFWPEGGFDAHANCCIRLAADLSKRERAVRRTRFIGLIWRALSGPIRHLYGEGYDLRDVVNALALPPLPKVTEGEPAASIT